MNVLSKSRDEFKSSFKSLEIANDEKNITDYEFLKLYLIFQAKDEYDFFEYYAMTNKIPKFLDSENYFFQNISNTEIQEKCLFEHLNFFLMNIQRLCGQFADDLGFLNKKLLAKTKTEEKFTQKYPKPNSTPSTFLTNIRNNYKETENLVKKELEKNDNFFKKSILSYQNIMNYFNSFNDILNLYEDSPNIAAYFSVDASLQWLKSFHNQIKSEVERKIQIHKDIKENIKITKNQTNLISQKKKFTMNICHHPKNVCIGKCGHTFCRNCLVENIKSKGEICPICLSPFSSSEDLINIAWQ